MAGNPQQPWQTRWREGRTGWDQAGPHPLLEIGLQAAEMMGGLLPGALVHEPGCGRAHNAFALAERGFKVIASDFVPEAITEARTLYQHPNLTLRVEDALTVMPGEDERYDMVFDRAMLCALEPPFRLLYLAACARRLKPGGLFLSFPFAALDPEFEGGPPFALSERELMALLTPAFTIASWTRHESESVPSVVRAEFVLVARKKVRGDEA